jgi:co-chaperonin GroES (HSP10)
MKRIFLISAILVICASMVAGAATISGVVSDSAGAPIKNIVLALKATKGTGGTTFARDTTDSAGAYSIAFDSTTGSYFVRSSDAAGVYIQQFDSIAVDGTNKTLNIKMAKIIRATVSGTVTDSAAATPLEGVVVRIGNARRDTTGADGKYSVDSVTTGTSISFGATGYVTKSLTPAIGAAAVTLDVALAKTKMCTVSGTITDSAAATPLSGAIVSLSKSGSTKVDTTAADGKYSFDSVTTGSTISVSATGYVAKTVTPAIGDSALTVDIALAKVKYGTLSGTITDSATGTAIAGVAVRYSKSGTTKRDTTGADGKYSFDSLTSGTATVSVSVHGYGSKSSSVAVVVDSAKTADLALVAATYGSIAGTVTDSASGAVIAGAIVALQPRTGMAGSKVDTVGADGSFLFTEVELGTYMVTGSATKYNIGIDSVAVSDTARKTVALKLAPVIFFAVSGKIVDSVTGAAVAGALVALRSGTGVSSTIDSIVTDTSGNYSFDSASTGMRLKITVTGYDTTRVQLTGTTTAAQTITVKMQKPRSAVLVSKIAGSQPAINLTGDRLVVRSGAEAGMIRLVNLKGELIASQSVPAGAAASIKLGKLLPTGTYIIKVTRKSGSLMERVLVR